jgi:predicted AAA+ superfamily ATPase
MDLKTRNGQFLILGSASPDLIRQSSESLAGRISYLDLSPFLLSEINASSTDKTRDLWLRGGFPRSFLAPDLDLAFKWRGDFILTFLERDLGAMGFSLPPARLGRFWKMCAHLHGSLFNASKLADSLGVSSHTTRSYLDLLEQTFMTRVLLSDTPNLKKRLVKSPKVYIRDSGILHALLAIRTQDDLLSHPVLGVSFEGFAIENILACTPGWEASFYRTSAGAEIDLLLRQGRKTLAFEFKSSSTPKVARGFWSALDDICPDEAYVVAPVDESYPLKGGITASPLGEILAKFLKMSG